SLVDNFSDILKRILTSLRDTNLGILILASILITAMLIDMIISSFIDVIGSLTSQWGIVLFIVLLAVIFGTGQYLLLGFVKQVSKDLRKKKIDIAVTYRIVVVVQYVVSAILILVVLQIILGSYYSARLIIAATLVSYIPATIIMGILSYRFYSWYKSNKNTI